MSEETQPAAIPAAQAELKPLEFIQGEAIKLPIPINDGSQIGGISLRGLLAIAVILTVCYMSIAKTPVVEPLYTLCTVVVAFYFGHQVGQASKKVGS